MAVESTSTQVVPGCAGIASVAQLCQGFPNSSDGPLADELAGRSVWWPNGVPTGLWTGIASSRVPRGGARWQLWWAAFRAAYGCVHDGSLLVTAKKTATEPMVARIAERDARGLITIHEPGSRDRFSEWLRSLASWQHDAGHVALVSPPKNDTELAKTDLPLRDVCLFAACQQLLVCHVRPRGSLERLVRLSGPRDGMALVDHEQLVPKSLLTDWRLAGGQTFEVVPRRRAPVAPRPPKPTGERLLSASDLSANEFLTHCTRAPRGRWPDQTEKAYLDALLDGVETTPRSALDTLLRILQQGRILAGAHAIRGDFQVVCFTAVSVAQLSKLRTYRQHRCRWDFEPYGICIRKRALEHLGARPVQYGDDATWELLTEGERPFFQQRFSGRGKRTIDWSVEQEWRKTGDVELANFRPDDVIVFVPSAREAQRVADAGPWRVALV